MSNSVLCRPGEPQSENQRKRKERQILRPCKRIKKVMDLKVTVIPIAIGALGTTNKDLVRDWES